MKRGSNRTKTVLNRLLENDGNEYKGNRCVVLLSDQRHVAYTLLFVRGRGKRSHESGFSNLVGKVWLCYVALTSETRYRCVAISND